MLVRVSYSKSEALGLHFDEYQNRMTSGLQYEDWAEFMVVWRRDKIELYEDYVGKFAARVSFCVNLLTEYTGQGTPYRS